MPSERDQGQIDRLLDEAEVGAVQEDWDLVLRWAKHVLTISIPMTSTPISSSLPLDGRWKSGDAQEVEPKGLACSHRSCSARSGR